MRLVNEEFPQNNIYKMFSEEMCHDIIHTNLCLLKEKGHKISFQEGMFRHRNQPGFEEVGYALLSVIDPVECKKTIPWPLFDDKTAKNQFRINFVKFIKMINKKHPDAQIPEMTASSLQHPGGERFLRSMVKLSCFTVKLELERMIGPEQLSKVCPQLKNSDSVTSKDIAIMSKITDGTLKGLEQSTQELLSFEATATSKLQQLKSINKCLTTEVVNVSKKLENEIGQLQLVKEDVKKRLQNVEDENVLSEWNLETEEKIKMLETRSTNLCRIRDITAKSVQLTKAMEKTRTDTLCLDGNHLLIPPQIDELTGSPVMNTRGQIRLEVLLKAGAAAARKLAPFSQPTPDLPVNPLARNLLKDFRQQEATATDTTQSLLNLCSESKEAIEKTIPIISAKMEGKEFPDHLKYLDDRPPLQFLCEEASSPSMLSPLPKQNRMSLNSVVNLQPEKGRRVVCSIRRRRSVSKYSFEQTPRQPSPYAVNKLKAKTSIAPRFGFRVPSTGEAQRTRMAVTRPEIKQSLATSTLNKNMVTSTMTKNVAYNLKTSPRTTLVSAKNKNRIGKAIPACKKSIYGELPSGSRIQANEGIAELSVDDDFSHLVSENSFSESRLINESQECLASEKNNSTTEKNEADTPPKKPRKSILDIVERYNKLRASMKPTLPNKKT